MASVDVGDQARALSTRAFDRRLLKLAFGERRSLAGAVALGLVIAGTRIGQGVALAYGLGAVYSGHSWSAILPWLALAVSLVAVRAIATALQGGAMAGASVRITTDLRLRLVGRILRRGPGWVARERSGELEAVLVDGVEKLDAYYRLFLAKVIVAGITAIAIVVTVIVIDPVVGSIIGFFAAIVVFLPSIEYRALGSRMRFWSESYRPLAAEFVDNLQGMATLKTFGVARRRGAELAERSGDVRDAAIRLISTSGVYWGLMTFAAGAGVAAGLSVGALRMANGELTAQQLLLILLLVGECFLPAREIHEAMHLAVWGMSKAERAFSILESGPATTLTEVQIPAAPRTTGPALSFEGVTFRYRADGEAALEDLSFTVDAGETLALVGPSGAGKTTVASLLLRFYDPEAGRITVEGTDVSLVDPDEVRRHIALVPQDSFLFHASIRDNISLADPAADSYTIERAARLANATTFIDTLPARYDTVVGERGLRLSGGERQRIAIARALLKDAPILILDEATSSVDVASEAGIQESLRELRRGRTTLVIAHRMSTVRDADRILVLDRGRIVEEGSHDSLLGRRGRYARLVEAQRSS